MLQNRRSVAHRHEKPSFDRSGVGGDVGAQRTIDRVKKVSEGHIGVIGSANIDGQRHIDSPGIIPIRPGKSHRLPVPVSFQNILFVAAKYS